MLCIFIHTSIVLQVSTAVRMSDGAIVVVDVIEGVSAQVRGSRRTHENAI